MLLFFSISLIIYIIFCLYMFKKFEKSENFMKDFDILVKVSKIIKNKTFFIIFIYIFWRFYSYFIYRPEEHVVYADTLKHLNDAVSHCMRRNVTLIDCTSRRGIVPYQFTVKEPLFLLLIKKIFVWSANIIFLLKRILVCFFRVIMKIYQKIFLAMQLIFISVL